MKLASRVLLAIALLLVPYSTSAQSPGQVTAQPGNLAGLLFASSFGQWQVPQGNAGQFSWSSANFCKANADGFYLNPVFAVGTPVTIVDAVAANTETVVPTAVTVTGSGCSITVNPTHPHLSFYLTSGTGGLQEAINFARNLPYQVVVTSDWSRLGGQTGMLSAAINGTNVGVVDWRTNCPVPYSWSGSAYSAGSSWCSGGGSTTVVEVNGVPISPASPANFVDTASVTWAFTGSQIEATAAGGTGVCGPLPGDATSTQCGTNALTNLNGATSELSGFGHNAVSNVGVGEGGPQTAQYVVGVGTDAASTLLGQSLQIVGVGANASSQMADGTDIVGVGDNAASQSGGCTDVVGLGDNTSTGCVISIQIVGIGDNSASNVATTSDDIIGVGNNAASNIGAGSSDVVGIGDLSVSNLGAGSDDIIGIGHCAAATLGAASSDVIQIGHSTLCGYSSTVYTDSIAIGNNQISASHQVTLGDAAITQLRLYGCPSGKVALADGSGTCVTPSSGGVTSINTNAGAFTFSFSAGAGSCSGTTCTFTGSGSGGGSVTNFVASSGSWPTWLVPSVATSTTTPTLSVSASAIPNSALANAATTVNGQTCTLGSTCTITVGTGTVTNFSAGTLSPLFTTSVATATTTPALTFSLSNAAQNSVFAGPASGGAGAPSYQTAPTISAANMTSFPTLNQNTTGNAATATALAGTPTLCSSGNAPTGILANGNATGCAAIGGGSTVWSALTSATGNLSLSNAAYSTTFNQVSTGSGDLFKWADTGTGTGILGHFTVALGSSEIPWQADVNGLGWKVGIDGSLTAVGSSPSHGLTIPGGSALSGLANALVITTNSSGLAFFNENNTGASRVCTAANGQCPGGTTSPGGTNGQVEFNNAGAFGGFTVSGDGTLNTSTGALTVTKSSGVAFGTAAFDNTGTSGAVIPLLNGGNAWSALNQFSAGLLVGSTGITIASGTPASGVAGSAIVASDASHGYLMTNENNTGLVRVCTASNGICNPLYFNGTLRTTPLHAAGLATLSAGTVNVSLPFSFTSTSTFGCSVNDQTAFNSSSSTNLAANQIQLQGTGTHSIFYDCVGY